VLRYHDRYDFVNYVDACPPSSPTEVVGDPFDVVFTEIVPGLNLDEDDVFRADIGEAMTGPGGDVHGPAGRQGYFLPVHGGHGLPPEEIPVFGAATVSLQAQTLTGIDGDALDLVIGRVG